MKNRIVWALIALNVLLAVTLVARYGGDNQALAQARGPARPADYIMIHGQVNGQASSVVYIVDTTNGQLGAMVYDDSAKVLNTMPPIDLGRAFDAGPGGRGAPPTGTPGGRVR